jgi:hypothetical protein
MKTELTDEVLSRLEKRIAEAEYRVVADDEIGINELLALSEMYDEYRGILAEVGEVPHD